MTCEPIPSGDSVRFDSARFTSGNAHFEYPGSGDMNMAKNTKAEKKPTHPAIADVATRLQAIRDEWDEREQAVLDAEAQRDAAKEHYERLHAAAFGSEFGVFTGGTGSDTEDKEGKIIPPNWDILMGDIPEPEDESDDDK